MAGHYVYQLAEDFPRELRYANAVCKFEMVRGDYDGQWVLRARKFVPPTFCEITSSRFGHRALQATLRSGFLVAADTPAAKPLDRLVQKGFATRRWASRRDLH
jgi:hypothetical protein